MSDADNDDEEIKSLKAMGPLIGSGKILVDDLQAASAEIKQLLLDSIEESAKKL